MKNKPLFTGLSLCLLPLASSFAARPGGTEGAPKQPNILFILLDDLAYDAIGGSGRYPFLRTPAIDRLQQEGITFRNFFCTMSLSSPSRACFLTGMYPHKHGVTQNHEKVDADWDSYPPYPVYLQQKGYQSAFIGKMHQAALWDADQVRPGFDYWLGFRHQGNYFKNTFNENGREFVQEGYITDLLTDYAVAWLTGKRDKQKPFSLCLWHKAVHGPFKAAPRHEGSYRNEPLPLPPQGNGVETFEGKPEWQKYKKSFYRIWDRDPEWNPGFREPKDILETLRAVDESIARVMEVLEAAGELENTVVIFSSDNGYFMGEHGFWDKRISYEECMRIPFIVRMPGKLHAGTTVEPMCLNIDLAPTLLQLAGADAPAHIQGKSLLPFLQGKRVRNWRNSFLFEYFVDDAYPYAGPTQFVVRTERYKLVDCQLPDDLDELYDLKADPGEMRNLIADPAYRRTVSELRTELERLRKETGFHPDRDFWLRQQLPLWDARNGHRTEEE